MSGETVSSRDEGGSLVSSIAARGSDAPAGQPNGGNRRSGADATCACGARWGGLSTAHCSGCHRTFTGITAFDKHRDGSHATGRFCRDPHTVGLVDANRSYPCWGFPNDGTWKGPL